MAASGDMAMKAMEDTAREKGSYVMIVEGAIATKDNGVYCELGERNGQGITALEHLTTLGQDAMAVLALGTCTSYGGIPAAAPNVTGCKGVKEVFIANGIQTPVINLAGCPVHPDWFVGTLASILIGGLGSVEVDDIGRPLAFYGQLIHYNCPRRVDFNVGKFARTFSEPYCLYQLGCKGPVTHSDCPIRLWNSGTNWCVGSNSPCIGCVEPGFPDKVSPLMKVGEVAAVAALTSLPPMEEETTGLSPGLVAGLGAVGGIAVGAAAVALARRAAKDKKGKGEGKTEG
jgi:hydrogenase small subunit